LFVAYNGSIFIQIRPMISFRHTHNCTVSGTWSFKPENG